MIPDVVEEECAGSSRRVNREQCCSEDTREVTLMSWSWRCYFHVPGDAAFGSTYDMLLQNLVSTFNDVRRKRQAGVLLEEIDLRLVKDKRAQSGLSKSQLNELVLDSQCIL